jgi:hypothetical protein
MQYRIGIHENAAVDAEAGIPFQEKHKSLSQLVCDPARLRRLPEARVEPRCRWRFDQNGFVCMALPPVQSPRLSSQQGVFLFNGAEAMHFEESLDSMMHGHRSRWYKRFRVPYSALPEIERELFQINVHELSLFRMSKGWPVLSDRRYDCTGENERALLVAATRIEARSGNPPHMFCTVFVQSIRQTWPFLAFLGI